MHGAHVANLPISHFVMEPTKEAHSNLLYLLQKAPKLHTCAHVRKQITQASVTEVIKLCDSSSPFFLHLKLSS